MVAKLEQLIFGQRRAILFFFAALTIFFGYRATQLGIDAGFEKLLPTEHPYIQTFLKHRENFGGANRLLIAVRAKEGDIFTAEFFDTMKQVTDEVFFLPGVNRSTVQSIFTPNVRFIEIVEGGFTGGNVIPADFQATPTQLNQVRENILKSGTVGRLVANDFTTAMVTAQLVENDPTTGEKLNYLNVADALEEKIREPYVSESIDIHIIGFAKTMGDIADGASGVVLFFGIALVITAFLVYLFTHSWKLTGLLLLCSITAVIWNLGILDLIGFGMDPMSLLVPFLVFAIGVSHGVQMVNAVGSEIAKGESSLASARHAFRNLIAPGWVALLSDTVGFLTLLLIGVRIIQELAITSSIGVLVIILTNLVLLPVLLSYVSYHPKYRERLARSAEQKEPFCKWASRFATPRVAIPTFLVCLILCAYGLVVGRNLAIGDIHAGVPELRPESRYNQDTAMISEKFSIGLDILTALVETVGDGCVDFEVMDRVDHFQAELAQIEGVRSTISLPQVAKVINAGWNEGHLKWRALPRNPASLSQAVSPVETATGLLNSDCSVLPVMIFLEDHKAETIVQVVDAVERYAAVFDSEKFTFKLATGNVGVMAATNQVVKSAQFEMLLYVYIAVILLCLITFRSWRAVLCIILPLSLVSVLAYALMSWLGIGLKTSTLPVTALGVGIGVDYGIYIFSRLKTLLDDASQELTLVDAYLQTLRVTGSAVVFTGLTLAIGVSTWIFSALQFQADMGILLTFMFLANMLGAILVLPGLAWMFYGPRNGVLPAKANS